MTHQQINTIKALFLLLVFSLNTLAGFACSIGVDMGYNQGHHSYDLPKSQAHTASHNKKHQHHNSEHAKKNTASHPGSTKHDCCSNDVTKFSLLDKSVSKYNLNLKAPVFLLAFTVSFLSSSDLMVPSLAVNSKFQFVRRRHLLNDTDIRIAIQSFQI